MPNCLADFFANLVRKKGVAQNLQSTELLRILRLSDLIFLSIGSMFGSGLYVLTGTIVRDVAGPSTVISYVLAAIASALSAVCYAEFAARIPIAGSAYQFTYISVGEIWAFIIGWNVAYEHVVAVSAVARSWSAYLDQLMGNKMQDYLASHAPMAGGLIAPYPDVLSVVLCLIVTIIVACGVKGSSKVNMAFSILNVAVIVFISATGFYLAEGNNWTHVQGGFFPHGASGTLAATSTLIFSYTGYEIIASATEESINPHRDVPIALFVSMLIAAIAYVSATTALTLMVPWYTVNHYSPFPSAYETKGWVWCQYIITVGSLAAMSSSMLGGMLVIPRYVYSMARDGLLLECFCRVNPKTQVPVIATVVSGIFCAMNALVFNTTTLVELLSIGQLLACTFVSMCVIKLRYSPNVISEHERRTNSMQMLVSQSDVAPSTSTTRLLCSSQSEVGTVKDKFASWKTLVRWTQKFKPGKIPFFLLMLSIATSSAAIVLVLYRETWMAEIWSCVIVSVFVLVSFTSLLLITAFKQDKGMRTYKVPLVPFIPFLSIIINITLILKLSPMTWIRLAAWILVGFVIYFGYGYRHSKAKTEVSEYL